MQWNTIVIVRVSRVPPSLKTSSGEKTNKLHHVDDQLIKERTSKKDLLEKYRMTNKLILKTANDLVDEVAKMEEESNKILDQMARLVLSEKKSKKEERKLQDTLDAELTIKTQLLENIACLQGQVSQLEEELKDNSQVLQDVTIAYTKLQQDLYEVRDRHTIAKTELTKNKKITGSISSVENALEDKLWEVQQSLSNAQAENDRLKEKLASLEKEKQSVREADDVLKLQQMQQRLEEEQAKRKATKAQLIHKNKTIANLEDAIRQLTEAQSKAQDENNQLNQKVVDLEKGLKSVQSNVVTTLLYPPNELEQRQEQGQTDYEAAKSHLVGKKKSIMNTEDREGEKNQAQQSSKQKNDAQTEWPLFKMLKHQLKGRLPNQTKKLKTKETDVTLKLQQMQQCLEEEQTKNKTTKAQLIQKNKTIASLEDEIKQLTEAQSQTQNENDQLNQKVVDLEMGLKSVQSSVGTTCSYPPIEMEQRQEQGQTDYEAAKSQLAAKKKNVMSVSNSNSTEGTRGRECERNQAQPNPKRRNDVQTDWPLLKMLKRQLKGRHQNQTKLKTETDVTLRLQQMQQRLEEERTKNEDTKAHLTHKNKVIADLEDKIRQEQQALSLAQIENDQLNQKLDNLEKKKSQGRDPKNRSSRDEEDGTDFIIESAKPRDQETSACHQISDHTTDSNFIQGAGDKNCDDG